MTPERWEAVKRLFTDALELGDGARSAFLESACAGDGDLRAEVEVLLLAEGRAGGFLRQPAAELLSGGSDAPVEGERIGPWRIIREIAHGGMGAVWLGVRDDDAYHKQVAIKLVRTFAASGMLLERFRQERHILAALDHPHIARLLDAGTTPAGVPWLAMEHVDGVPIDRYCEARALAVRERLELFRAVCAAVQFAHQNLVVHRDIKPANILVTAEGTPKLLDFGIAKLLGEGVADAAGRTTTGFLMTPEYASPEQVRNEPVTTATDVYSLGVLLYRLLTGTSPYRVRGESVLDVIEAVRDQDPVPPGAKVRSLRGDLDTIVLRAMRKEPRERYASVDELSADIERYLTGHPVRARKPTAPYRMGKFVRRHKGGVLAAVLVFALLAAGMAVTARQARIAHAERVRAEQRFRDVRALANSLLFELHDAVENLPGSTAARELIVKKALEYLDNLAQEAGNDASLQQELAAAYEKVGDVQGRLFRANLGQTAAARASYAKALAIREALVKAWPSRAGYRRDLAASYTKTAQMLFAAGDPRASAEVHRKAVELRAALWKEDPSDPGAKHMFASARADLGYMLGASGNAAAALDELRPSLRMLEETTGVDPRSMAMRQRLGVVHTYVGTVLFRLANDPRGALDEFSAAIAVDRELHAADPANVVISRHLVADLNEIADVHSSMGDAAAALAANEDALSILAPLAAADPANAQYAADLAVLRADIGSEQARLGRVNDAFVNLRAALAVHEAEVATNPTVFARAHLANTSAGLGAAYAAAAKASRPDAERARNLRDARAWYTKARDLWLALRNDGAATGNEAARVDELTRAIAECDR